MAMLPIDLLLPIHICWVRTILGIKGQFGTPLWAPLRGSVSLFWCELGDRCNGFSLASPTKRVIDQILESITTEAGHESKWIADL